MKQFEHLVIDISGCCNARCKWCSTGILNLKNGYMKQPIMMSHQKYKNILDYIGEKRFVCSDIQVELFNWGEPFLNPELNEICLETAKRGYTYRLSTNGSILKLLEPEAIKQMDDICFSVSGFTQESYGKIHGLQLSKVLSNIATISEHFIKYGYENKLVMNFHVYQYNIDEIMLAKKFCEQYHIRLIPHLAYLADAESMWQFRESKMPYDKLNEASKEIFLYL